VKIIREHINEKFTEESDPIADMNIGMMHQIKLWMKSIDEPFRNKDNALECSAVYGKLDFVEYLLAAGADVHADDDYALRYASDNGHTEVVKVLLAAGANVHARDDLALQWASIHGRTEVVKVLLAAGADVHTDNEGALRWASNNGHTEVVKVLKDHIAKEKKIKESVNEKFTEDSDPIEDMSIGLVKEIRKKIDSLQISRGVGSINLKHKKNKNNFFYYIEINFYFGSLPYMIDLFFEKIDEKYIKSNWYISIGSLKTTIGFIIKPECENLFKRVFKKII